MGRNLQVYYVMRGRVRGSLFAENPSNVTGLERYTCEVVQSIYLAGGTH